MFLFLLQPSVNSEEYKPVVKKSVTYIVAAVLFNERGEVLMMQVRKKDKHPCLFEQGLGL